MQTKFLQPTDEALTERFPVGKRYRCTLTMPLGAPASGVGFMTCEWSPDAPSKLSPDELADYRRGRHALLLRAAAALGATVALVEL